MPLLVDLVHETTGGSASVVATSLAYPLADVLLLAVVVAVLSLIRWRPDRAWLAIGAGLSRPQWPTGSTCTRARPGRTSRNGRGRLWPASTLLIALAAWQPARCAGDVDLSGRPLLATPAAAGLMGLALLVYDHFEPQSALVVALSAAAVIAVFVRTA